MRGDELRTAICRIFEKRKSCIQLQHSVNTLSRQMMQQDAINSFLDENLTKVETKTYILLCDRNYTVHGNEIDEILQLKFGLTRDKTSQNKFVVLGCNYNTTEVDEIKHVDGLVFVFILTDADDDYYIKLNELTEEFNEHIVLIDYRNKNKQGLILACTQMLLHSEILQSTSKAEDPDQLLQTVAESLSNLNLTPSNLLLK
jgi:5S rRNA maturation endonuclease (ribonuclease M5)